VVKTEQIKKTLLLSLLLCCFGLIFEGYLRVPELFALLLPNCIGND